MLPPEKDKYGHNQITKGREIFQNILEPPSRDVRDTLYNFLRAAVVVVSSVFLLLLLLAAFFQGTSAIGQAGDFFGGFVNPLLTFLTFSGVLYTIYIQRQDLEQARREGREHSNFLARQNFETTLFQMLNLHNNIVDAMDFKDDSVQTTLKGRDCFKAFQSHLNTAYKHEKTKNFNRPMMKQLSDAYDSMWRAHQQDLAHYFRYLYNVVRYVDEANIPKVAETDFWSRMTYMRFLRAQLSDDELKLLMYNSLLSRGEKFKTYVEKYSLLDNIPDSAALDITHFGFFEPSAFGTGLVREK